MPISRRTLVRTGSTAGLLLGCRTTPPPANASVNAPTASPMQYSPQPLSLDPAKLQGLSEKLLRSHYDNNYLGAVKKLNGVRERLAETTTDTPPYVLDGLARGELTFKHSVVLHELYFGNLSAGGSTGSVTQALLSEHFGGAAGWEQRWRALAMTLAGGSGWLIVEYDFHEQVPRMYTAADHAQGLSSGLPLLVLDMYEHSYHMDYGTAAARYVDAFLANVHWSEVDRRTELALKTASAFGREGA